jgi:hypothetical protein
VVTQFDAGWDYKLLAGEAFHGWDPSQRFSSSYTKGLYDISQASVLLALLAIF